MDKYFIIHNDNTNLDLNLLIPTRPSIPVPEMEYEEVRVPGGKTLYIEKGYKDIEIPIKFNFTSDSNEYNEKFRKIKQWLLNKKSEKLKLSDDLDVFYKINKVTIETPERVIKKIGRFVATFTCEPYCYIEEEEIELGTLLYNNYLVARPIYRIVGEGYISFAINNKIIKANVGQELVIDTEKGLCYKNREVNNIALDGRYEDMYLLEGENTFSWTNEFKIYIVPNWRCL